MSDPPEVPRNEAVSNRRDDHRSTDELIQLALAQEDENEALEYAYILQTRGTRDVFDAAFHLCESGIARERELGVDIVSQNIVGEKSYQEEVVVFLLQLLEKEQVGRVLESICWALGHRRDPRAIAPVARLKKHPESDVRYAVAHGMWSYDDPLAIQTLIELSEDEEGYVRDWATFGLGTLIETDTSEIRAALLERVDDTHRDTRGEALIGLARRKDKRVIPALIREIEAPDVGGSALEAASAIADPVLCPALLQLKSEIGEDEELDEALDACGCTVQNEAPTISS